MRSTIALSAIAAVALAQTNADKQVCAMLQDPIDQVTCLASAATGEAVIDYSDYFNSPNSTDFAAAFNSPNATSPELSVVLNATDAASAVADAFGIIIETVADSIDNEEFSINDQDWIKDAVRNATDAIDRAQESVEDLRDSNRGYSYSSYNYDSYNYNSYKNDSSYYYYNYGEENASPDLEAEKAAAEAAAASYYKSQDSYAFTNLMQAKTSLMYDDYYNSMAAAQTGANVVAIVVSLIVSLCCLGFIICCLCFYCAAKTATNTLNDQLNQPLIDEEGQDKQQLN